MFFIYLFDVNFLICFKNKKKNKNKTKIQTHPTLNQSNLI